MSHTPMPSRRKALQLLAGAPLLPLGASASAASLLTGCGGSDTPSYASTSFSSMAAPTLSTPAAMATTTVGSTMTVQFSDASTKSYQLAYQPFFVTGDSVSNGSGSTVVAGGYYDINNAAIMDTSVSGSERQFFSDCPDGMSLIKLDNPTVSGVTGNTVFAVVQFEYTTRNLGGTSMYGLLPSPIAVLTLDQDKSTGKLSLVKYHNVDTSGVKGLWITCGASLSPWNTHLSSEEYEPDATLSTNTQLQGFSKNLFGSTSTANPYDYGHLPEVTVLPDGTGTIQKHYCLGRISHELVQVMPDNRTVLMGDDATNGALFMFVADTAKDLSAGTLYAGKWTQTSATGAGSGTITWIRLGHATSAEIKALVTGGIKSTDIMTVLTSDPSDSSYTKIYFSGKKNWVKLATATSAYDAATIKKAAAFLETHRYAALLGASAGFTKMEGTTVNIADKKAYSAMSYIQTSMVAGNAANQGDIALAKAIKAGAVYEHTLSSGQSDTDGTAIDSAWVSTAMSAPSALVGEDLTTADSLGNLANADKIANPDNIKFSEKMRTLFIGEDSGLHVNNFLWAYNVDTKVLSRILSVPAGAESTGLQSVDEINGWTYIMSNFQHAGDWETPLHDVVKATLDPLVRANYKDRYGAAVGYLTGSPTQMTLQA